MRSRTRRSLIGLYRSRDGIFLGVCRGLADRFDFSAWGIRALFVALQLILWHWTFLVYLALALLMRPDPMNRFERRLRRMRYW